MAMEISRDRVLRLPRKSKRNADRRLLDCSPEPEYTETAAIDPFRHSQQLKLHEQDLHELRKVLLSRYWPKVEISPPEIYRGLPLYPGRVSLGTNDGALIFAHLRKLQDGNTGFEIFYYHNDNDEAETGMEEYGNSDFESWCYLLADDQARVGDSGAWKDRVQNITKLVMLEAGYYDGSLDIQLPAIVESISRNMKHGITDRGAYMTAGNTPVIARVGLPWLSSAETSNKSRATQDSMDRKKLMQLSGPEVAEVYIKALRDVVPAHDWFKIELLRSEEIVNLQKGWNGSKGLQLYPGKVFLGQVTGEPGMRVWAAIRKLNGESKQGAKWELLVFNDKFTRMELPYPSSTEVELAPVFNLLRKENILTPGATDWRVNVSMCIRAALMEIGYLDTAEFKARTNVTPAHLKALISKNLIAQQALPQLKTLSIGSDACKETQKKHGLDSEVQTAGALNNTSKKQKVGYNDSLSLLEFLEPSGGSNFSNGVRNESSRVTSVLEKQNAILGRDIRELENQLSGHKEYIRELEAQVDKQRQEIGLLKTQGSEKNKRIETLSNEKSTLKDQNKALYSIKDAHIEHCQPLMLELLTRKQLKNGGDRDLAVMDAKLEYEEIYGIRVADRNVN